MQNDKKQLLIAGVLVALLIAAIGFSRRSQEESAQLPEASLSPSPSATAVAPAAVPKPPSSSPATAKAYTDMVKEYTDRRIQFDMYCQAIPGNVTYKNGTSIMLDNRSGDARKIKVGDIAYQLPGYGYRVVNLTSTTLPKTIFLSCGSAVNVGQILLQR